MIQDPQRSADVLIVAPHAPDLAGMRQYIGDRLEGVIRDLRVHTKIVGLGMPVAAAACARGILAIQPRVVVMIGTAGVYPDQTQYRPHDVVVPTRAQLFDHAAHAQRSSFPEPMQTVVECDGVLGKALQQSHSRAFLAPVASTLTHTTDDLLAGAVNPSSGCEAENLELFGIAVACRAAEVPFTAALGISNLVGSTGRQDWTQFHRDAVISAANAIGAWLHNGAVGLPR